jgi:hypothetical protein
MDFKMMFYNNTNLPVYVETWEYICIGLSRTVDVLIQPHEKKEITSITGECNIHIMFTGSEKELWNTWMKTHNIHLPPYLGSFRKHCSYNGDISSMETKYFSMKKREDIYLLEELVI